MKELNIYVDMDGVLANFNAEPNAVERFKNELGFFERLKPIQSNVSFVNKLIENNFNVFILSASPNDNADNDKIKWLKRFLPHLQPQNIIIIRNGQNKADFVLTKENNILFDDYGKNCRDFLNRGYMSCQVKKYLTIRKLFQEL